MQPLEGAGLDCPWCGQPNEIGIEPGDTGQELTLDCAVCCQPMVVVHTLNASGEAEVVEVRRE